MWKAKWAGLADMARTMDNAAEYDFDYFSQFMREVETELVGYVKIALMGRPGGGASVAEYVEGASTGISNSFRGMEGLMAGYSLKAPYPERDSGAGRHYFVEAGQVATDRTGRTYDNRFAGTPFYDDTYSFGVMIFTDGLDDIISRVFSG